MQQQSRLYNIVISTLFTGSVFLTSGEFVNATNTPKFYFVEVLLCVSIIILAISKRGFKTGSFTNYKTLLWGITVLVAQAFYGLCQYAGWLPPNNSGFPITGSFDNPAGFAAILSIGFPVGLFLLVKSKKTIRHLIIAGMLVIATSVFLSGSRAGMLSILISTSVFFLLQTDIIEKIKKIQFYKSFIILISIIILVTAYLFYQHKKDSAKGRILIWKVSTEMIKDKPIFGHGYGAFQAKYMDYQAEYFKNNPNSKYAQLADNVKHPFNEFIKIAVEFGIVGLGIFILFVLFVLWKIIKSKTENWVLVLSGLASLFVFACFSYPLQYVAVWLLVAFYLSLLLPLKEIKIKHTPITLIARGAVVVICMILLIYSYKQIRAEIKWKTIAMSSLNGNTKKMLPEYGKLYSTSLMQHPFFLYNYGAELNFAGQFDKSIEILTECRKWFNDYDLQMLLADNYRKKRESGKAIQVYQHASNMVPCRFLPLFHIFEIYKENGQRKEALQYAQEINNNKVKIPSLTITRIKAEAKDFLNEQQINTK